MGFLSYKLDFEAEIKMIHIYTQCRWQSSILRMGKFENICEPSLSVFVPAVKALKKLEESYSQRFIFRLSLGEYGHLVSTGWVDFP